MHRKADAIEQDGFRKRSTSQQLLTAAYGDIHGARLKETLERGDHWRLKNEILRGELLRKSLLVPALEQIFTIIRQLIESSSMTSLEKKDLLLNISSWPIAVRTAATKAAMQTRFTGAEETNGDNGHGEEAGGQEAEED